MKAYELSVLTGTQVLLLVVSETGLVYTFTTPKLQPLVTKAEGKNLIQVRILFFFFFFFFFVVAIYNCSLTLGFPLQACLNTPDPASNENGVDATSDVPAETPEDSQQANMPRPTATGMHPGYMTNEQQQQMASYYQNLQQQQQQTGTQYPAMSPVGNRISTQHQPTA